MRFDAAFYRNLASMHRAGLDWSQALASVDDGRGTLVEARRRVEQGEVISDALGPQLPPLARALLRSGEASGRLEQTLAQLAEEEEGEARTRSELRTATLYPLVLAHVGFGLIAVPDLLAGKIGNALLWAVLLLGPMYLWWWWIARGLRPAAPDERPRLPRLRVGPFLARVELADARGLTALAACHDAGLPLLETLEYATRAGAGGRAAVDLFAARVLVQQGHPMSPAFQHLPDPIASALSIAEQTGDMSAAARHGASSLRFDASQRLKRFRTVVPVFIFLMVAAVIASRIFGFYSDHYSQLNRLR